LDTSGRIFPELHRAIERGVILDSSQGRTNFSFDVTRRLAEQGVMPHVISSDLTGGGRTWIVYSLIECMNKFLALGYPLDQVIRMTTLAPAQALGMTDALGAICVGREADLTLLELAPGRWRFQDSFGRWLDCEQALIPTATVRAGELIMPDWGPHPWGWEPAPGPLARAPRTS
jgi:dihydroorotase